MVDTSAWCGTALKSVMSLWEKENFARRDSTDEDSEDHPLSYRPTATFHAIVAMGECGIWEPEVKIKDGVVITPFFEFPYPETPPSPRDVLIAFVSDDVRRGSTGSPSPLWARKRIDSSSHAKRPTSFQPSLVIGGLFQALRVLLAAGALKPKVNEAKAAQPLASDSTPTKDPLAAVVREGFAEASKRLLKLAEPRATDADHSGEDAKLRIMAEAELSEHEEVSTNLLLHLAIALTERKKIITGAKLWGLELDNDPDQIRDGLRALEQSLTGYFRRQVDRLMARRHVPLTPEYDPTSLAFAIRGLTLLDEKACDASLFRASVQAVVEGQHPDGCWPDGVSVTYRDDRSTIQQPSVEVALCLAQSAFNHDMLVVHNADQIDVLEAALPALEKTATYLTASYITASDGSSGWVSDRTRSPGMAETWITSFTARLFRTMFLAERARSRATILEKYRVAIDANAGAVKQDAGDGSRRWQKKMIEPDAVLRPANDLLEKVIQPLEEQRRRGLPIRRPKKNGVSFIIYGPPGSGKTFMVEQLADALGWPLLALNPGHFIQHGLEHIESTAAEIFGDLMNLDHTVVFFDECDELFRERFTQGGGGRNILSFATASMLPKLQALHDARRVVFFLGTNFLSNVDTAIRRPGRFDDALLFDRPDTEARINLLRQGWEMVPDECSKLAADQTKGWMSKDVLDLGSALKAKYGADPARLSLDAEAVRKVVDPRAEAAVPDYLDWCVRSGKDELEAAGLERTEDFWRVFDRWQALPDFYEEFRRHHKQSGPDAEAEADAFLAKLRTRVSRKQQQKGHP